MDGQTQAVRTSAMHLVGKSENPAFEGGGRQCFRLLNAHGIRILPAEKLEGVWQDKGGNCRVSEKNLRGYR